MRARPLFDATPLSTAHAARGIGAAVAGLLSGFAGLPSNRRPLVLLGADQPAPEGFAHARLARPGWRLDRLRLPDPWPALVGERRVRAGAGAGRLIHATAPELIPGGPTVATCYDLIPLALREHYLDGWGRAALRAGYMRQIARLRRADAVMAISPETAEDLVALAGVDRGRVHVIPLAAPMAVEPEGSIPEGPYALYSGSLEPHKNVPLILRAMSALPPDSRLRLVMCGGWSAGRLATARQLAGRLGLEGRVEWRGQVPAPELAALRQGARAVVVPSLKEGFGLPVVEAMRAGVPALVADTPSLAWVGGAAAVVLPSDRPMAWAEALTDQVSDSADRRRRIQEGRAQADRYDWRTSAAALWQLYDQVAA